MKKIMTPMDRIREQPCDKIVARALIDAGYYRPSYGNIAKWLWRNKGIMITPPSSHAGYYAVHIQYLTEDGKKEHPIVEEDGTAEGAYRAAILTVLELLAEKPPRLYWWERVSRRLGLLGETKNERWYRERVLPLKQSKPLARKTDGTDGMAVW